MKITLDIPDDLVHVVVKILEEQSYGNDAIVDVCIMQDLDIDAETFAKADNIANEISGEIQRQADLS